MNVSDARPYKTLDAWWKGDFEFIPVRSIGHTWKMSMLTIEKTLGHRRLFWAVACLVMSFYFFQCAAFSTLCLSPCPTSFDFSVSLGFSFVCVHVYLVILFPLLLDLGCVLEFPILPTISHGKSKDGIQPFKGPKPAARIANSLANRAYWAACRGWHTPVPFTLLSHPPYLLQTNRVYYLKPTTITDCLLWKTSKEN